MEFKALYLLHNEIDPYFWWWIESAQDLRAVADYATRFKRKPKGNEITDEMIQAAKQYPIEQLFEFRMGKTLSFCHTDKVPSLSWHEKANRVTCFPCAKSFNPIDVLIQRDGMNFYDAVRALQ